MNTRKQSIKILFLAAVLSVFATFSASLQAELLVYEPFDYPVGAINGLDVNAVGLTGKWISNYTDDNSKIKGWSMNYGDLPEGIGNLWGPGAVWTSPEIEAELDPAVMAGNLDDGDELWFSFIGNFNLSGETTQNGHRLQIGSHPDNNVGIFAAKTVAGQAEVRAAITIDGIESISTGSAVFDYEPAFFVGRVIFGETDTVEVYLPDENLSISSTPAGTVTGSLNQATFDMLRLVASNGNSGVNADEIRIGTKLTDVTKNMVISPVPKNGETVKKGNIELSWTNADPAELDDSVFVDVWFGNDPNLETQVVTAGENQTTVTVSAPGEGTYYWRVDSYVNGSAQGEPIEGALWSFNAVSDVPPVVDAGPDMITWSGQPVQLNATVIDDGSSALTYSWTAETDDPNDVDISATDIIDPIVTITKEYSNIAPIANAGFEDPVQTDGNWTDTAPPGWGWVGNNSAGVWNPDATGDIFYGYDGIAPEGENVAWIEEALVDSGLAQLLTDTLMADTTYTLSVEVGNNTYYETNYLVQLLAGGIQSSGTGEITGGTVIAQDDNSMAIADDTFATVSISYTYDQADAELVGQPLQIRLLCHPEGPGVDVETDFDDVKLTSDVPAFGFGVSSYTMKLGVSDAGTSNPVEDTVTIDVYDDPCKAAIAKDPGAINPGDLDGNCITDLNDLIVIVKAWLDEYALKEPIVK